MYLNKSQLLQTVSTVNVEPVDFCGLLRHKVHGCLVGTAAIVLVVVLVADGGEEEVVRVMLFFSPPLFRGGEDAGCCRIEGAATSEVSCEEGGVYDVRTVLATRKQQRRAKRVAVVRASCKLVALFFEVEIRNALLLRSSRPALVFCSSPLLTS